MKTQTTNMLRTAVYAATIAALLGLPAAAAAGQMRGMARTAETTPQHAEVANQQSHASHIARSDGAMAYKWPAMVNAAAAAGRMRGMARTAETTPQHAEAANQQSHASHIARSDSAMAYKWPAMVNRHQQAKEKAAQSRRAAAESPKPADDARVAGEALAK